MLFLKKISRIRRKKKTRKYYDSEESYYDLDYLFDTLNEIALPYFYFGSHPGDDSDYGFWLVDDIMNVFDGYRCNDLSMVPKNYIGEILYINDHGNLTLYVKTKRTLKEIWSIV